MTTIFPVTRMLDAALNGAFENYRETCCDGSSETAQSIQLTPRADVIEGDKEFRILMDLPGVANENLDISLENQTLSVKAVREAAVPEGFAGRRHERSGKVQFSRTFNLGSGFDSEQISAHLEAGVLQISLPKSEVAMARRIEVK
jgi:HSP20 family protein